MAEENPLVYSPIQNSVYTAIEYKAHTNGVAPDMSPAAYESMYYQESVNVSPRGGRLVTREGTQQQIGSTVTGESYFGGTEWITHEGSAITLGCFTNGVRYLSTGANSWVQIMTSAYTVLASGAHVDFVPMRTASSGLRIIAVAESPAVGTPEPVRWWNGSTSTTFTVLTTAVQGNCGVVWKSHFLMGDTWDTGDGHIPYRVHWSALGDPTVWSGTASAGSLDLTDGNLSKVMRFLPLRKELAAYKEFGAYAITYKGNPFWFTQTLLSEQINLLGRNAVCSVLGGDYHFLFSSDGMLLWDGQTVRKVGKDKVDRTILKELDWERLRFVSVSYFPPTKEVLVSYLARGAGDLEPTTWVYNLEYDSWWQWQSAAPLGGAVLYKTFSSAGPMLMAANRSNVSGVVSNVVGFYSGDKDFNITSSAATKITTLLTLGPLDFGHFGHKRTLKLAPILLARQTTSGTAPTISVLLTLFEMEVAVDTLNSPTASHVILYDIEPVSPVKLNYMSGHISSRYLRARMTWGHSSAAVEFAGMVFHAALRGDARIVR